jgi:putative hydrolase of the HAD superfamily
VQNFNYTRSEWHELVNQTFHGVAKTPVPMALFADLYSRFALPQAWRIFDDVRPRLELLKSRGLKLGIISNWDERLRPLLRRLKLDMYFQTIVVSCEVGACKPSPIIFQQATQKLLLEPREILHTGDSHSLDFDGATAAGFQALLVSRDKNLGPGRLNSLLELSSLLRQ